MNAVSEDRLDQVIAAIRDFMHREVFPLEPKLLAQGFDAAAEVLQAKRSEVRALGLWAPHIPQHLGGLGLSLPQFARVSEELGRSPVGHYLFNCQAPDVGNMEVLLVHGTAEQQATYLQPLIDGAIRSCFAMTEPENPGSNPTLMDTTAVVDGDTYLINGHKWFTSAADGAAFTIVMAVTDPAAESPYRRASQILVPLDTPGFRRIRNISVMGEPGAGYWSHSEVVFEDCRVPRANLLGKQGAGFTIAQERLGPGRIHHCMRWVGICERAFDLMCRRAAIREVAPGRPLGSQGMVQAWVAESRAEINAARLMVLQAAETIERSGAYAARDEISLIKFFVADVLQQVLDRAIQVHGALGMTDETPLAYWYRHERAARIYDGPDEVHKVAVARRILERYGMK